MLLVSDLKTTETGLPQRFLDLLPEECSFCGFPMSITPVLTTLSCSNNRCSSKVTVRLLAMLEQLGIKGIGEKTAESYVVEKSVLNPLSILWHSKEDTLTSNMSWETWERLYLQIEKAVSKGFFPWEIVQLLNIKGVQTSAEKLFLGDKSIEDELSAIEEGGVGYVQEKLGIEAEGGVSLRAIEVYTNIVDSKEDLLEAVKYLKVREVRHDLPTITVVCSSKVGGPYATKKAFADDMARIFEGKVNFNFKGSLTKAVDFLVWEGADGSPAAWTSKVQTATKWNEQSPGSIKIVTSKDFVVEVKEFLNAI